MIRFGVDGVVSFSKTPLRAAAYFGFAFGALGFLYALVTLAQFLLYRSFSLGVDHHHHPDLDLQRNAACLPGHPGRVPGRDLRRGEGAATLYRQRRVNFPPRPKRRYECRMHILQLDGVTALVDRIRRVDRPHLTKLLLQNGKDGSPTPSHSWCGPGGRSPIGKLPVNPESRAWAKAERPEPRRRAARTPCTSLASPRRSTRRSGSSQGDPEEASRRSSGCPSPPLTQGR